MNRLLVVLVALVLVGCGERVSVKIEAAPAATETTPVFKEHVACFGGIMNALQSMADRSASSASRQDLAAAAASSAKTLCPSARALEARDGTVACPIHGTAADHAAYFRQALPTIANADQRKRVEIYIDHEQALTSLLGTLTTAAARQGAGP